jgi:hypothetical protein
MHKIGYRVSAASSVKATGQSYTLDIGKDNKYCKKNIL